MSSNPLATATNQPPARPPDPFNATINACVKGLGTLVPDEVAKRLLRLLVVEATLTPAIRACTPLSIQRAIFMAGQLGLEFGGARGEVYAIPRKARANVNGEWVSVQELNVQVGYKGYLTLCRRAGVREVRTGLVWAWDTWDYAEGLDPVLRHVPAPPPDDAELDDRNLVAAYAVAIVDGRPVHRWMWRKEILDRRSRSDGWKSFDKGQAKSTPWVTDFASMVRKTVIRALLTGGTVPMHDPTGIGLASALLEDDAGAPERNAALAALAADNERAAALLEAAPEPPEEAPAK